MGLIGVFGIKTGSSNFTNKSITMNLTPLPGFYFIEVRLSKNILS